MALLLSICSTGSACGDSCTTMGCSPGANVVFSRALDASKEYSVRVVADGETSSCSVARNDSGECEFETVWTGSESTVASDGTPFPTGGFAGIFVPGQPSDLEVTVTEGGSVVADSKFDSIAYRGIEQNGEGCGTCSIASVSLTVP